MPSESKKQHNYFEMIANDKDKAKQEGVPQSVAREFVNADRKDKRYKKQDHVSAKADFSPLIAELLKKA
jgi:hypothetical protein